VRLHLLGGWSSGAVIAFEMARQLEQAGQTVDRVVLLDAPTPVGRGEIDDDLARAWFLEDLGQGAEELDGAFEVFRGVIEACNDYRPAPISAALTVIRARDGQVSEFADHPHADRPDWGWAELTSAAVRTVTVPGTHHTVLAEGRVRAVADLFNRQRQED
jgi:pyochelin synthetase